MTDLKNMSLEELNQRLVQLDEEWHAVYYAIEKRREQDVKDVAKEVRRMIVNQGFEVEEIMALVAGRGTAAAADSGYKVYLDPDNPENTYVRGPLPNWLKAKMTALGLDPSDKTQREAFKQQHLQVQN
jgi:DNA-binding protein H-NS